MNSILPNRFPGKCCICGGDVAAGKGHLSRYPNTGGWRVQCVPACSAVLDESKRIQPRQIGDLSGLLRLFDRAAGHLKRPAIRLTVPGGDLRLTLAGAKARQPGTVNVVDGDDATKWFGRVQRDGTYQPTGNASTRIDAITAALSALATDPEKVATAYGRLNGRCCFCSRPLTDDRSTAVGYGPDCADHFGLAWGDRPAEFAGPAVRPAAIDTSDIPETGEDWFASAKLR
jgi:hypothetical protein